MAKFITLHKGEIFMASRKGMGPPVPEGGFICKSIEDIVEVYRIHGPDGWFWTSHVKANDEKVMMLLCAEERIKGVRAG